MTKTEIVEAIFVSIGFIVLALALATEFYQALFGVN
jgi:hypothetical protein